MIERSIQKDSVIHYYHQLKEILRDQISNRTFKPHQQIPSEPELQKMYGLSRATIRKAIDGLVREGLIYRLHGKGTYVAEPRDRQSITLDYFTENMRSLFLSDHNRPADHTPERGGPRALAETRA